MRRLTLRVSVIQAPQLKHRIDMHVIKPKRTAVLRASYIPLIIA